MFNTPLVSGDVVVIASGKVAMTKLNALVVVEVAASVTRTVKLNVPPAAGVPLSVSSKSASRPASPVWSRPRKPSTAEAMSPSG